MALAATYEALAISEVNGYGHGDPRSPGTATDLHKTRLDRGQLTEVITCGRPGSEMPYFDKYAYEA